MADSPVKNAACPIRLENRNCCIIIHEMFEMFHVFLLKNEKMCAAEGYDIDEFVLVMKKPEE